ncbi:MAG TPA: methyltransferase domain-containing protein [Ktedonobacterales bacterium]
MQKSSATGRSYTNVDESANPTALADLLRTQSGFALVKAAKQIVFDALEVQPGNTVLDVGSGVGQDVLTLARMVGPTGRVVGVDKSATMIEEARKSVAGDAANLPVEFLVADAETTLPFADATFDRCHSERVLQHVSDGQRVVAEMARVLRPGGHIALIDADHASLIIDSPDRELTRTLVHHSASKVANGWAGRGLRRMVVTAGFVDVTCQPLSAVATASDYEVERDIYLRPMIEQAVADGVVTPQQGADWLAGLEQAARDDTFFVVGTMYLVSARRP